MRSGTKQKFAFGSDPGHINVPHGHPWLNAHASHDLIRCDITVFCRWCGGNSSGAKTSTVAEPCNPAIAPPCGESEKNRHYFQKLDKLRQGKCPYYPREWASGYCGLKKFPPLEVLLFRGTDRCHTKCACTRGIDRGTSHERFIGIGSLRVVASSQNTIEQQADTTQPAGQFAARRIQVEAPAIAGPAA